VKALEQSLPGLFVLESPVWGDERGFFREWFKLPDLELAGVRFSAQQANLSSSTRDVVRGLHYSLAPEGQAKVVTCVEGEIDDVIVDIRLGSPTFGRFEVVTLRAHEGRSVLLPRGVAHGFVVTSPTATLTYLLSSPYNPALEHGIHPFDTEINVPWALTGDAILSEKDADAPSFADQREANRLPVFEL